MSHDWHEQLPGYSPAQVLHDGCGECEHRAEQGDHGMSSLDVLSFQLAWHRATAFNTVGLTDVSLAERPLLNALWSVQLQMERMGALLGALPVSVPS